MGIYHSYVNTVTCTLIRAYFIRLDTVTITLSLLHRYSTLLFQELVSSLHGHSSILNIVISFYYTRAKFTPDVGFIYIQALMVPVFLLRESLLWLCGLLLHIYSCIPVPWILHACSSNPDIDMIFLLLDMWAIDMRSVKLSATWTKCHVELTTGPPLKSHISFSCFLLSCFMLSTKLMSCYRVTCTIHCSYSWYTV